MNTCNPAQDPAESLQQTEIPSQAKLATVRKLPIEKLTLNKVTEKLNKQVKNQNLSSISNCMTAQYEIYGI